MKITKTENRTFDIFRKINSLKWLCSNFQIIIKLNVTFFIALIISIDFYHTNVKLIF